MIIDGDIWKIDNEVKIYLNQVFNSTNKLIQLIWELLDLKQLDSENQDFYIEKINIKTLITNLYDEYKILAEQKSQSFILDIDYNDLIIKTDETKLKQVIVNLLSNSIKYTPEWWKIHISSFQKNNKLVILFKDNWYWINEKNHQILFDDFTRIKTEDTKHIEWTWLWLPIVKKIVEKLNWTIDVKSKEWKWSEFILIFNI
jgi:signal transduction histidine kinase